MPPGMGERMSQSHAVLLTRPLWQSEALADALRRAGVTGEIVISPILRIEPRTLTVDPAEYPTLIFTSINGVDAATPQADLSGHACFAVGDGTMERAQAAGLRCLSAQGTAEDLLKLLCDRRPDTPLLHLRGVHSSGNLAARLCAAGLRTDEAVIYDQHPEPLGACATSLLRGELSVILPVYSPRSARLLSGALGEIGEAGVVPTVIAISKAAAQAWQGPGRICVVSAPDGSSMFDAVLEACGV